MGLKKLDIISVSEEQGTVEICHKYEVRKRLFIVSEEIRKTRIIWFKNHSDL